MSRANAVCQIVIGQVD